MDERPNVFEDRFSIDRGGLRAEQVLARAGAHELGGTLYELAPGHERLPLHIHHAMEEVAILIAGTPTLRTSYTQKLWMTSRTKAAYLPG